MWYTSLIYTSSESSLQVSRSELSKTPSSVWRKELLFEGTAKHIRFGQLSLRDLISEELAEQKSPEAAVNQAH